MAPALGVRIINAFALAGRLVVWELLEGVKS